MRIISSSLLVVLLAGCGGGGGGSPPANPPTVVQGVDARFVPPTWSGSANVAHLDFHWTDASRAETLTATTSDLRELNVRLFYPTDSTTGDFRLPVVRDRHWQTLARAELEPGKVLRRSNYDGVSWSIEEDPTPAAAPARFPVVILSHGGGGAVARITFIAGELASRGWLVAAIDHSYHADFVEFPGGRVVYNVGFGLDSNPAISPSEEATLIAGHDIWSDDQLFVLDRLLALDLDASSPLFGRVDSTRVGAGGWSFGGAAGWHAAAKDGRIGAVFDLDGSIWGVGSKTIACPMLFVQSGTGSQLEVFDAVPAGGYAALFDGAIVHGSFEDLALFWKWDFPASTAFGSLGGEPALRSTVELTDQFLRKTFDGAAAPALDDALNHPLGARVIVYP